ncbi:flagellar motor protein MotB [Psychromonas marina]|uniref:Flagellar motor protein MotB n=1 Tax=Psychromonas marina TaxID=88364 RepID=A0ABQ6E318_9GAMM|nr:flagellar motor protein MotB [Psychromonas marina]GLS91595.1 flagellar motor protein MotB [Psychromonas marina]
MAEEECKCPPEGLPAWMGTFADLMSLLMCFFVLLLSFSEMDVLKFKQIAGSMKYAFGVQSMLEVKDIPKGTSVIAQEFRPGKPEPTPIEVIMQQTIDMTQAKLDFQDGDASRVGGQENIQSVKVETPEEIEEQSEADSRSETLEATPAASEQHSLAKKVAEELREEIEDGAIEIESLGQQLIIRVREKGAFPSGSAFLQPRFRPVIRKVAKILVDVPGVITISGHTDNEQVHSELYRSNWDLSAQRAVSVAHEMLNLRPMRDKKLVVVGYANSKPLTENKTRLERQRNRRVEIMIMQGDALETDEIGVTEK